MDPNSTSLRRMLDGRLLRKSDIILMTVSVVAGAPRTDDLLILVPAPPRVQSTYDCGRLVWP